MVRAERFEAVERAPATQCIQHETSHDGARVHVHCRRDVVIDQANEAPLVGVGLENRQRLNGVHFHRGLYVWHGSLPRGTLAA